MHINKDYQKIVFNGKSAFTHETGISAKIIADSISPDNIRLTTFELEYPRFIHGEFMTHRVFSRNAASSRAIPVMKKIKMIWDRPAMPVYWGKNQAGMKADEELTGFKKTVAKYTWIVASKVACGFAFVASKLGMHKQLAGRILEPFEIFKVIVTSTDFENFMWLRDHEDAQPEIQVLAYLMGEAMRNSTPQELQPGQWHLPYIKTVLLDNECMYITQDGDIVDLETAKHISASCCAQISYRLLNTSIEKAKDIFRRLIESVPIHASPAEHQATPMVIDTKSECIEEGITSIDVQTRIPKSGNLRGWIQFRQLIPNNAKQET